MSDTNISKETMKSVPKQNKNSQIQPVKKKVMNNKSVEKVTPKGDMNYVSRSSKPNKIEVFEDTMWWGGGYDSSDDF